MCLFVGLESLEYDPIVPSHQSKELVEGMLVFRADKSNPWVDIAKL